MDSPNIKSFVKHREHPVEVIERVGSSPLRVAQILTVLRNRPKASRFFWHSQQQDAIRRETLGQIIDRAFSVGFWSIVRIRHLAEKQSLAETVRVLSDRFEDDFPGSAIGQKQPFGPAPESGHSYSFPDPENCPQVSVILELLYGQSEFQVTVRFE